MQKSTIKRLLSTIAISAVLTTPMVSPAHAVAPITLIVSTSGTANPTGTDCMHPNVVLSGGNGFEGLLDQVNLGQTIPPGSTIRLCGDISISYKLGRVANSILKPVTFLGDASGQGPAITYNGNAASESFFTVQAPVGSEVNFIGLTFLHDGPATTVNGGAIRARSGKLYVEHSSFVGFETTGNGGAISLETTSPLDKAVMNGVAFLGNKAANGGAIYVKDGAIGQDAGGQALVRNALFNDNQATNDGGAIYSPHITDLVESIIDIDHATFVDNTAASSGAVLSGADISVKNSIIAQRSSTTDLCKGDVLILDRNLLTDATCGVTNSFPLTGQNKSALVRYSQLKLGHYNPNIVTFPSIAIRENSVAIDFVPAAEDDATQVDIRGRQRTGARDAGSYEATTADRNLANLPTVTQTGYVRSRNDSAGANFIDAYRFGANNYRVDTLEFAANANGAQLNNISYTSLTPDICTLSDNTDLSTFAVPNAETSHGICTIEVYHAPFGGKAELLTYIELNIYFGTPPSTPRNVRVASGETAINVSFQAPLDPGAGISGYQLRINGPKNFESLTNCDGVAFTCAAVGLNRVTSYTVTLMVFSAGNLVTNFDLGTTRTLQQKQPSAATAVVAKATPKGGITVTWKAPTVSGRTPLASYMVRVYLASAPNKVLKVVTAKLNKRIAVIKGLKAKKKYLVRVLAYNTDGYVSSVAKTVTVK